MCEFEILIKNIREKYNLKETQSVPNFVDNLVNEVAEYKRRSHAWETVVNDIRAVLGLQTGESIIEAVAILKRNK